MHRRLAVTLSLAALALGLGSVMPPAGPASAQTAGAGAASAPEAFHMTLVGHADMSSGGEGFAMKLTRDGRRVLYVAHESGPHCFTVFDVTDPARPRTLRVVDTVSPDVRCNSLDVSGNVLAVAAETKEQGQPGGGFRLYALDDPTSPRFVSYFDASGPHSRGAHHVWLSSERLAHITSGSADFVPKRTSDDEFYRIIDISDTAHPKEIGRWWYPGQRAGDAETPNEIPMPDESNQGIRPHNIDVFPSRPDRAYLGYIDGGLVILDIGDPAHPKTLSIVRYVGPFTHTVFPLLDRNLAFVSEEAVLDGCADAPKRMTVWDISDETKPRLLDAVPYAQNSAALCKAGGRFGPHNIYEDKPYGPTFRSSRYMITSWFGGGVRVYDVADPLHPIEAAYYVPAAPADSPKHAIQINDVFVDDRGVVYACDRFTGGLFILRSDVLTSK